jgi:hypothetical protein
MNLGISGDTTQIPVMILIFISIAPVALFFGIVKIRSEFNKRKRS